MWCFLLCLTTISHYILVTQSAPLIPTEDFNRVVEYLNRYGYLHTDSPSVHELQEGLRLFQEVAGIPVTGEVDQQTREMTQKSRCVQKDIIVKHGRKRRFALASFSKWPRKHFTDSGELRLTWFVADYTKDLSVKTTKSIIKQAFQIWSSQSNHYLLPQVKLKIEEASSRAEANIEIKWAKGDHGDAYKFDGVHTGTDNILAHTFFPGHAEPLNGDIHFDDDEKWEVDLEKTKNSEHRFFPYVLAHEIGHVLGLQHSHREGALMYPYYRDIPLEQLHLNVDDQCGINWNYAGPSNFCLFVWLMTEIVTARNNDSDLTGSDHVMSGNHRVTNGAKKFLKNARIPRCVPNNDLQLHAKRKLRRFLNFPEEEAGKYSEVVCHFLAGLHVYRGGPDYQPDEPLDKQYLGVSREISELGPMTVQSIRRLARNAENEMDENDNTIFDRDYYNEKFFDNFIPLYLEHRLTKK